MTTTYDELRACEQQIEELLPQVVARIQPMLLQNGAKRPLSGASRELQEQICCKYDSDFRELCKRAHELNLRWNIEQGWY